MVHLQVQIHSCTGWTTVGGTELVAVQKNMMRWVNREYVRSSLSSLTCVPVLKASLPTLAPRRLMVNSRCTLSSCSHLLSSLQGCDYHCTNVAHAQNTMSRVPLNGLWQAWVWLFFSNTESAWMTYEFLHLRWIVFIVVVAISGIQLSPWEPVYLYSTVSDHCKISVFCNLHYGVYSGASCRTPPVSPVGVAWTCRTNALIQDNRERQII